ncbi:hypothetical protein OHR68_09950 [Spirillospora sp. NBC_00431]
MIGRLYQQQVTIEPFTGEGANGALYGAAVTVRCRVQEAETYKRGRDGSADRHEVTETTTVYMPLATECPPRSRITLPSGQVGTATEVHRRAVPARMAHLEVHVV